jgi:hypothetical protein
MPTRDDGASDGGKYLHDDFAFGTRDDLIPPVERVSDAGEIRRSRPLHGHVVGTVMVTRR